MINSIEFSAHNELDIKFVPSYNIKANEHCILVLRLIDVKLLKAVIEHHESKNKNDL